MPVFFLPITQDFFEFNKMILLAVGTVLGVLFWALSNSRGDFKLRVTPLDLPVLAFAVIVGAAGFFATPNKINAFVFPGLATQVIAASIFYFLVVQFLRKNTTEGAAISGSNILSAFAAGTAVAALLSVLAASTGLSLLGKTLGLPVWLQSPLFNPVGGALPAVTLFVVTLPLLLERTLKRSAGRTVSVVLLGLVVAGLAASLFYVFPGRETAPRILPVATGWSIALETLKQNPVFGVGPGNFIEAFNRFRPVAHNTTDVWNLKFLASSNWYLHLWTVTGLLGIVSFLWIVLTALRNFKGNLNGVSYSLLAAAVLFLLLPASLSLIFAFYLILAHLAFSRGKDIGLQFSATQVQDGGHRTKTNFLPGLAALIAFASLLVGGYYLYRVYSADVIYQRGLVKAATSVGEAYADLAEARRLNPYLDTYRLTFAQASLAIANAIAGNQSATEAEKQNISPLIQQAIREGQAAVANNQRKSDNWVALAQTYQAIMPLAQGADQYAISTYSQAIALDPVNPLVRVSLGGVLFSLKQYEEAVKIFELAVSAKPDFANARYNLAVALREKGDIERAYQEMTNAVSLVDKDTPGYDQAKTELAALEKLVKEKAATAAAQAKQGTTPQPALQPPPSPQPEGTIELPPDSAPPAAEEPEVVPAPTATPTATPGQ